ncbi:hypothetical protein SEA_MUSETTA_59 [Microbacterium phage Musetta]|nr:hypothetical protein SEA_LYELL_59 [Microbacterium phage Lyell]AXC36281.2 hypothetical protein SEA_FORK_55 [Microbacterium phage Fork]AXH50215.1 hypothetical protein SEA_MUSETTA_59 [Microbacterium phage Musetta]QWS69424.1 hypothetical protein SEA_NECROPHOXINUS_61 [Microbacterium phage Necrophoxinus]URM87462.1 hypothetical protein SEA_DUSTYDINO_62 [Microbacterium phage DustyDino]UVK62473.1 hypothetical protein SEA_YUMA_58 [Microbacterium phage Yuma]WMI33930.1 hypothetical protein SEA_ERENYEA
MTGPKLVLPSLAMPWGRWAEDGNSSTSSALARMAQDSRSAGLGFSSKVDNLSSQIRQIPSLAGVFEQTLPTFSVSRPSPVGTFRVWDSPQVTINPPEPGRAYTTSVIAVIRVTGVNLTFGRSYLRLNGKDDSFSHENMQGSNGAIFSIMGTTETFPGEAVTVSFAVSGSSVGTATFTDCKIYTIFNGRIQ